MERISSLPLLPPRPATGHKGTFGTVLIVGGSAGDVRMIGAPALAACGAARAGAGLVQILAPAPIIDAVIGAALFAIGVAVPVASGDLMDPQAAVLSFDRIAATASSIVIGPGLGAGPAVSALALRAITQDAVPVVIDADAINELATHPEIWKDLRAPAVLTPHPGEFVRLERAVKSNSNGSIPATDDEREERCAALAQRLGAVVVLKGAGTIVSDGTRVWRCDAGHPCLATGGTGDVLAGVIGGLIAATGSPCDCFILAAIAVMAHARAGETWARTRGASAGMLATELAELIPAELECLRQA